MPNQEDRTSEPGDEYGRSLREEVLSRARDALGGLNGDAERDARRILDLCQVPWEPDGEAPASEVIEREQWARELARLTELVARRSSRAMPFAALARAALAAYRGHAADSRALLRECQDKLALFGF